MAVYGNAEQAVIDLNQRTEATSSVVETSCLRLLESGNQGTGIY